MQKIQMSQKVSVVLDNLHLLEIAYRTHNAKQTIQSTS